MFARALAAPFILAAAAVMAQTPILTVPLGKKPRQVERPIHPIEEWGPQWAAACGDSTDWDQPAPPVRIHANTYLVGTCGITAVRFCALTASAESLPSLMSAIVVVASCALKSARPATSSVTASAAPRNGMCCASKPALMRSRSAPKCDAEPMPADE